MRQLQTPAGFQEIPLCSTPGEDGGHRKKRPLVIFLPGEKGR